MKYYCDINKMASISFFDDILLVEILFDNGRTDSLTFNNSEDLEILKNKLSRYQNIFIIDNVKGK